MKMPKATCIESLRDGQLTRKKSPLFQGCYKLKEAITEFSNISAELDRIKAVRLKKESPYTLRHCTSEDAHIWIRKIPAHVAHCLGRNVLPSLLASVYEGAQPENVCKAYLDLSHRCQALANNMDSLMQGAGNKTLQTCDLLKPQIEVAIQLARQALSVADPHERWN
jgi:hypothetical protein